MNTNDQKLISGEEVRQIVGCAFEVLNTLGCGLLEKPYENALCVEFKLRGIPFMQQPRYDVFYKWHSCILVFIRGRHEKKPRMTQA